MFKDSALTLSPEALRNCLELNTVVPAEINRLFYPQMLPGSSIVYVLALACVLIHESWLANSQPRALDRFVGSTLSEKAVANTASYVTAKHAMVGLMRATCQDLAAAAAPVHTALVCPGFTGALDVPFDVILPVRHSWLL